MVGGNHRAFPLTEDEIALLFTLVSTRLAVSVTNSAHRKTLLPEDAYVTISEAPAWEALERLGRVHPRLAHYTFREACGNLRDKGSSWYRVSDRAFPRNRALGDKLEG